MSWRRFGSFSLSAQIWLSYAEEIPIGFPKDRTEFLEQWNQRAAVMDSFPKEYLRQLQTWPPTQAWYSEHGKAKREGNITTSTYGGTLKGRDKPIPGFLIHGDGASSSSTSASSPRSSSANDRDPSTSTSSSDSFFLTTIHDRCRLSNSNCAHCQRIRTAITTISS